MGLLHAAVAIIGFLSVGHTAPTTNCEALTKKIDIKGRDQLLGKWIFIAESIAIPGISKLTKKYVDSAFVNITAAPESNTVNFVQMQKTLGSCIFYSSSSILANNSISMEKPYKASEFLLTTSCPDCLVILGNFTLGQNYYLSLQFISKRRQVTMAELDEFKKQVACLNLPPPSILDPEKELCEEQDSGNTDVTELWNSDMAVQVFGMLESAINSEAGLADFFNTLIENMQNIKTN